MLQKLPNKLKNYEDYIQPKQMTTDKSTRTCIKIPEKKIIMKVGWHEQTIKSNSLSHNIMKNDMKENVEIIQCPQFDNKYKLTH